MSRVMERLTFANVMSVVAVFIAIGGGAYAAGLAKDSVKSKQIAANAVKQSELAGNAVTADKIADGSVTTAEIANNAVNGAKVNEGSLGQVPLAAVAAKATNTLGAIVNANGTLSSEAQSGTTSTRNGLKPATTPSGSAGTWRTARLSLRSATTSATSPTPARSAPRSTSTTRSSSRPATPRARRPTTASS